MRSRHTTSTMRRFLTQDSSAMVANIRRARRRGLWRAGRHWWCTYPVTRNLWTFWWISKSTTNESATPPHQQIDGMFFYWQTALGDLPRELAFTQLLSHGTLLNLDHTMKKTATLSTPIFSYKQLKISNQTLDRKNIKQFQSLKLAKKV